MASPHDERELKWALEADAYQRLCGLLDGLLGPAQVLAQDNRFFDSADHRLQRARRSIRLRRENSRLVLTCKAKGELAADGLHQHEEWEREVDPALWSRLDRPASLELPLPPAWTTLLAGAPLISLGGFANLRREHHDGPHLLCLDRTDFGRRIDHELEIETAEPAAALVRWRGLLAQWGINWTPQLLTKLHRYLQG